MIDYNNKCKTEYQLMYSVPFLHLEHLATAEVGIKCDDVELRVTEYLHLCQEYSN